MKVSLPMHEAGGADLLVERLCRSFGDYASSWCGRRGQIRFPFGWCKLEAHGSTLHITVGAEDGEGLRSVEEVVSDRLRRVARRHRHRLEACE